MKLKVKLKAGNFNLGWNFKGANGSTESWTKIFEDFLKKSVFSSSTERLPRTPIISTRYGKIQGRVHSLPGQDDLPRVEVYHGIPYATPPVSSNR